MPIIFAIVVTSLKSVWIYYWEDTQPALKNLNCLNVCLSYVITKLQATGEFIEGSTIIRRWWLKWDMMCGECGGG